MKRALLRSGNINLRGTLRLQKANMANSVVKDSQGLSNGSNVLPLFDIGCNLLDPMYRGEYRGKKRHESDLDLVIQRGWDTGVAGVMITAGTSSEATAALELSHSDPRLYCTVGVHPTRCDEFEACEGGGEAYMAKLLATAQEGAAAGKVVAVGELGLDYDRLQFCKKETQLKWFEAQLLELVPVLKTPLFLHSRAADEDMLRLLRKHSVVDGVVHSFTGSMDEMEALVELGLHIGINGCSLKTEANLRVVEAIPTDKLLLETDGPWCDIRRTHAGYAHIETQFDTKKDKAFMRGVCVKNRTEPCHIIQVLEVVAGCRGVDKAFLADKVMANTKRLFRL